MIQNSYETATAKCVATSSSDRIVQTSTAENAFQITFGDVIPTGSKSFTYTKRISLELKRGWFSWFTLYAINFLANNVDGPFCMFFR